MPGRRRDVDTTRGTAKRWYEIPWIIVAWQLSWCGPELAVWGPE